MKTGRKINRDLILNGNMLQAILSIAIPVVINSFLQTMYNLTDTYWLGKIYDHEFCGPSASRTGSEKSGRNSLRQLIS